MIVIQKWHDGQIYIYIIYLRTFGLGEIILWSVVNPNLHIYYFYLC